MEFWGHSASISQDIGKAPVAKMVSTSYRLRGVCLACRFLSYRGLINRHLVEGVVGKVGFLGRNASDRRLCNYRAPPGVPTFFFLAAPESPIECECVRAHVSPAPSDVVRLGKREVGGRGGRSALPSQPNKLSPYPEPRERERLDVRS